MRSLLDLIMVEFEIQKQKQALLTRLEQVYIYIHVCSFSVKHSCFEQKQKQLQEVFC